jgi:hypothetical protein
MPSLRFAALGAAALAAAALGGCASSGIIGADLVKNGRAVDPVLISWKSKDGSIDGTMTATLPDATFQGRFMQITHEVESDTLAPMWAGWPVGWSDWPGYGPGWAMAPMSPMLPMDAVQFSTAYSGKVVANLKSPGGELMRCRFQMTRPDAGMAGGGTGECQLAGGESVQATF